MTQLEDDIQALKSSGMIKIAGQYQKMASALRVIHTWASFEMGTGKKALYAGDVISLTDKALKRYAKEVFDFRTK